MRHKKVRLRLYRTSEPPTRPESDARWIRMTAEDRDRLLSIASLDPLVSELVLRWDVARPEDWIAQLIRVNQQLLFEARRNSVAAGAARGTADSGHKAG
jgi:hypothetical protein